jgi:hypothetical protein
MKTQIEQVIDVMRQRGGYATFGDLNRLVDFSTWETKTPQATVRRIVQVNNAFLKIRPGLWALKELESDVLEKLKLKSQDEKQTELFTHSYYQGLIVEIGNMSEFKTYVPPQDKNRRFLEKPLKELASLRAIHDFTYPEILRRAKTIDVIWFNDRKLPHSFFEIEHSTDIRNSLRKFFELQDYRARFFIIADKSRKKQFDTIIEESIFSPIKGLVTFRDYDSIVSQHAGMRKTKHVI